MEIEHQSTTQQQQQNINMASSNHTATFPDISNVTKVSSRKRNEPEDEDETEEYNNKQSRTKKTARVVSVANNLPEPGTELGQVVELPATFDTLDDDCLGNVLEFVGKKCYSAFGRVNKRCHEMFCSKGYTKETYLFGYAPLRLIQQRKEFYSEKIAKGVLHYNRRDIFEWLLADENDDDSYFNLQILCWYAIEDSRLDILREVFQRVNEQNLEYLRAYSLCYAAIVKGKLECLSWLRENECGWGDRWAWNIAKREGHEHILEYLRNNGYPTEWQVDSESESESEDSDY